MGPPIRLLHRVACPVTDGGRGVLHVELERRAARHRAVDEAVIDAEVFGERRRRVTHAHARRQDAVELRLGHAAVGQGPLGRLDVVAHGVEMGRLRVVAQPDPRDHWCAVRHGAGP
jgi:hypothetical protein